MKADSTQPIATPVDRFEKFLASQNGCFPNERPCKACAIAFAASETAALTQQVADLQAEVARLRGASPGPCAKCEAPLVVVDGGHWTCYKCALRETEELWSKSARLRECVECGQNSFAISPVHPSQGFCWTCHKLLTIEALAGEKHDG
jgi:hypothetical protein